MVNSELKPSQQTENILIHYCNICGSTFLRMEKAEECELSHKKQIKDKGTTKDPNNKYKNTPERKSKYVVLVTEAYNKKVHKYTLEAFNVRDAANQVRSKFPNHYGYSIGPKK